MWAEACRWSAILVGGVAVVMWTFALVAQTFVEPIEGTPSAAAIAIVIFVSVNPVAFLTATRYQRWGGLAMLVAGLVFSVVAVSTAGHNHWLAAIVSGGPFVASGALFLLTSSLRRDTPSRRDPQPVEPYVQGQQDQTADPVVTSPERQHDNDESDHDRSRDRPGDNETRGH